MAMKYTNIFQSKALQNLPKLVFLVRKQTIWQPCSASILQVWVKPDPTTTAKTATTLAGGVESCSQSYDL
jgi:hypothetical protein